jgi:Conserved in the green lineage and diatoms 27
VKNTSVSICPVPQEQRPVNEYQELKESWFFSWVTLNWSQYLAKLAWVWGWSCLVSGPVAAASFSPVKYPAQFVLCGAAVVYEESGWYDGQSWTKTPEVLLQDQLIVNYQLEPILKRLRQTFYGLVLLLVAGGIIWNCL